MPYGSYSKKEKKKKQSCKVNCPLRDEGKVDDNRKVDEKRNMEVMNFNIYFLPEFQEGRRRRTWSNFPKGMSQKSGNESLLIKVYLKGLFKRE